MEELKRELTCLECGATDDIRDVLLGEHTMTKLCNNCRKTKYVPMMIQRDPIMIYSKRDEIHIWQHSKYQGKVIEEDE